ncbi:MAG: DUF481 domain-containing protein [Calditrichaeota bacterium]|nr:MAG: DUF481 domain-containing protein [Calditrichota bacterium]
MLISIIFTFLFLFNGLVNIEASQKAKCGLIIQTLDENLNSIEIDYEITDSIGKLKTSIQNQATTKSKSVWILNEGEYKIFGLGSSFDLTNFNFVRVNLSDGEVKNLSIIFNSKTEEVIGEFSTQTWTAKNPIAQEKEINPNFSPGEGGLLIPVMTDNATEPPFTIVNSEGNKFYDQEMGKVIKLTPGNYSVIVGEFIRGREIEIKNIEVLPQETTIVKPTWSSLIINVVDKDRNQLNEAYEIYSLPEYSNYGQGTGREEGFGENLRVWTLAPGIYKIIQSGESQNTYENFTTVQLQQGELTQLTVVIDEETGDFIGAGVLDIASTNVEIARNWKVFRALYGNLQIVNTKDELSDESETSIIFSIQADINSKYENDRISFLSKLFIDESFTREEGARFETTRDEIRFRNTGIFRLTKRRFLLVRELGIYGRFYVTSKAFRQLQNLDSEFEVLKIDPATQDTLIESNVDQTELSPSFFPLTLEEGIGFNINVMKTTNSNINFRAGLGYKQIYNKDSYEFTSDNETQKIYTKIDDNKVEGFEFSFLNELKPIRRVTINNEFNIILPFDKEKSNSFDGESQINIKLFKNTSLDYTFRISKAEDADKPNFENILQLRFSIIF